MIPSTSRSNADTASSSGGIQAQPSAGSTHRTDAHRPAEGDVLAQDLTISGRTACRWR